MPEPVIEMNQVNDPMREDQIIPSGLTSRRRFLAALAAGAGVGLLAPGLVHAGNEASSEPRWWKGNLHTHSLWSDGDDFPEMAVDWYRQHDYHFLALTDHNVLLSGDKWVAVDKLPGGGAASYERYLARFGKDWVETREENGARQVRLQTLDKLRARFERPGRFLLLQGEELSDRPAGERKPIHVNAINLAQYIAPQGGQLALDTLRRDVAAVLAHGQEIHLPILAVMNHPNFGWALTPEDLARAENGRFFEVYNGHPKVNNEGDATRPSTERMWDLALAWRLAAGKQILYGLATDDTHNYHEQAINRANPGRGWIMVRAPKLTPDHLLRAMQAGDFYASTGVALDDVAFDGRRLALRIHPASGETCKTQFIGARKGDSESQAGRVLAEVEGLAPSYAMQGNELYVRAKVVSTQAPQSPSTPLQRFQCAWTQPVVPA